MYGHKLSKELIIGCFQGWELYGQGRCSHPSFLTPICNSIYGLWALFGFFLLLVATELFWRSGFNSEKQLQSPDKEWAKTQIMRTLILSKQHSYRKTGEDIHLSPLPQVKASR